MHVSHFDTPLAVGNRLLIYLLPECRVNKFLAVCYTVLRFRMNQLAISGGERHEEYNRGVPL
jgi:hypothetical protein